MKKFFYIFFAVLLLNSTAFAKGSSKKKELFWFGLGSGDVEYTDPKDQMTVNNSVYLEIGTEVMALGPLGGFLSISGTLSDGEMDYNYLGKDSVNYTANDLGYSSSTKALNAGLKLRVINASFLNIYAAGGVSYGALDYTYNVTSSTLSSQGSKYETSTKELQYVGQFAEAGIDFLPSKEFGIRVAGRMAENISEKLKTLGDKSLEFNDTYYFLSFITGTK